MWKCIPLIPAVVRQRKEELCLVCIGMLGQPGVHGERLSHHPHPTTATTPMPKIETVKTVTGDTYENLYLSPLRSFFEKTFCKLEQKEDVKH